MPDILKDFFMKHLQGIRNIEKMEQKYRRTRNIDFLNAGGWLNYLHSYDISFRKFNRCYKCNTYNK
jgi:hypothetical protein